MKHSSIFFLLLMCGITACRDGDSESDAYGNFEADVTTISSEGSGTLLAFRVREGRRLAGGEIAAVVDTTQLVLERSELQARRRAAQSRVDNVLAQLDVMAERRQIALRERTRFENLFENDAAPRSQLDDVEDQILVLDREMASVRSQIATLRNEVDAFDAQLARMADRIARHVVVNPFEGTVLTTFVEPHELTSAGRPLYTIADLDTLLLKVYVSGRQLPNVPLGGAVEVLVDAAGGGLRAHPGTVARIASEAEFTPRLIQTREDRVDLVYAVDVRVANADGTLKIGMPGEVRFLGRADEE